MSAKHEGFSEAYLTYFDAFQSDVKKLSLLSSDIMLLGMNDSERQLRFFFLKSIRFQLILKIF